MPDTVKKAVTLLYISLCFAALQVFIILSSDVYRPYFGFGDIFSVALFWFVTHMVANGKNWARVMLVIMFIAGVPTLYFAFKTIFSARAFDNWWCWFVLGRMILAIIAIVFLFQRTSSYWFKQVKENKRTNAQQSYSSSDYYPDRVHDSHGSSHHTGAGNSVDYSDVSYTIIEKNPSKIIITCQQCGQKLRVPRYKTVDVTCSNCKSVFRNYPDRRSL